MSTVSQRQLGREMKNATDYNLIGETGRMIHYFFDFLVLLCNVGKIPIRKDES